jgi:hypothetical protein
MAKLDEWQLRKHPPIFTDNAGAMAHRVQRRHGRCKTPSAEQWLPRPALLPGSGLTNPGQGSSPQLACHIDMSLSPHLADLLALTFQVLDLKAAAIPPQDLETKWPDRHLFFHKGCWAKADLKGLQGRINPELPATNTCRVRLRNGVKSA